MDQALIKIASVPAERGGSLASELAVALRQTKTALVVLFVSHLVDRDRLAAELNLAFPGTPLIACTTAGEIGPHGYETASITGVSFPAESFTVELARFDQLKDLAFAAWTEQAKAAARRLEERTATAAPRNVFGFVLIDGLSLREEPLVRTLYAALGRIPLVGGSAGDGLRFERTYLYIDGAFCTDAAVLALISTALPTRIFKTQHFLRSDLRLVVTEADPASRCVREIDGLPAAAAYARVLGLDVGGLTPAVFAANPVVVRVGDSDYVRSIQTANADGSLTFYCAIDAGIVLTVARGVDLVSNLETAFAGLREEIGEPQAILGCDCILRCLEVHQKALLTQVSEVLAANHVVGFNTYGEQYCGMHVNQTFTGVAIGAPPAPAAEGAA